MITRRHKPVTVLKPSTMYTNRNDVMKKGKALILALPERERERIYNKLDGYDKEMFNHVANFCYANC